MQSRKAFLALAALAAFLDILSKEWVFARVETGRAVPVIEGFLLFRPHYNPAGPWSWGLGLPPETLRYLFPLLSLAAVVLLVQLMLRSDPADRVKAWGFLLILGGAAGNLWDRVHAILDPMVTPLMQRGVRDFIFFPNIVFGRDFPAFNLADTWITAGVVLVAWRFLREKPASEARAPVPAEGEGVRA